MNRRGVPTLRVVGTVAAVACVAGAAVLVVKIAAPPSHPVAAASSSSATSTPGVPAPTLVYVGGRLVTVPALPSTTPSTAIARTVTAPTPPSGTTASGTPKPPGTPTAQPTSSARGSSASPGPVRGSSLPLNLSTGSATQVITVVASSYDGPTTATLQVWNKAPGGGWLRWGPAILAHVGANGISWSPSEAISATPAGSFTLTHAFGWGGNPGTALPYVVTNPSDWWISQCYGSSACQSGVAADNNCYNTMQSQPTSSCPFSRSSPNEPLSSIGVYQHAVVIDYNIPSPGHRAVPGAGSAFFLHITDNSPTAGCVAIPLGNLDAIMQWLTPARNPRILIGAD